MADAVCSSIAALCALNKPACRKAASTALPIRFEIRGSTFRALAPRRLCDGLDRRHCGATLI
jgi:hypothetical protein